MAAAGPSWEGEDLARRRSYAVESHELERYQSHYSDATTAHHRATSRARSRQSLGPPKGLARVPFEVKKFWRRQISVVVDEAYNRDHLGTETLFFPAISPFLYLVSGVFLSVQPTPGCVYPRPGLGMSRRFLLLFSRVLDWMAEKQLPQAQCWSLNSRSPARHE